VSVEISGQKELLVKSNPLNSISKTYQFDRWIIKRSSMVNLDI
jgi:hypothetical protein